MESGDDGEVGVHFERGGFVVMVGETGGELTQRWGGVVLGAVDLGVDLAGESDEMVGVLAAGDVDVELGSAGGRGEEAGGGGKCLALDPVAGDGVGVLDSDHALFVGIEVVVEERAGHGDHPETVEANHQAVVLVGVVAWFDLLDHALRAVEEVEVGPVLWVEIVVALASDDAVPLDENAILAYLAASRCVPDPQNPANWVLTPLDTVVVRDLATGSEQRWTDAELAGLDAATLSYELLIETELRGLAWLGDDELVVPGHRFRAADLERTGDAAQFFGTEPFGGVVVGWDAASGAVLVEEVVRDDAGETTGANLVAVDPISGERSVVATTPAGPWVFWGAFAVDDSGTAILNRGPGV